MSNIYYEQHSTLMPMRHRNVEFNHTYLNRLLSGMYILTASRSRTSATKDKIGLLIAGAGVNRSCHAAGRYARPSARDSSGTTRRGAATPRFPIAQPDCK